MQTQFAEFFEDINDALREAVRQLGGNKKLGATLRPELPVTQAENWLRDCLNPERREKLSPEQLMLILSMASAEGYHGTMAFIAQMSRYEPPRPVTLEQQEADLQARFIESVDAQQRLLTQMQRLQGLRPVRAA
jgi:hypothetical protein